MTIMSILAAASAGGLTLSVVDGKLRLDSMAKPPDQLIEAIREQRDPIIRHLSGNSIGSSAIAETGTRTARPDLHPESVTIADGVRKLAAMASLFPATQQDRWNAFVVDALAFDAKWTPTAIAAGWLPVELFGLSASAPWANWRSFGLVPMLNGDWVTAIKSEAVAITTKALNRQVMRRRGPWHDAKPAWDLGG